MKRLTSILAISVIAVMSAGAARADIASTTYVDNKVTPVSAKANTNASEIKTLKETKENVANKVASGGDMEKALAATDADTKYPTLKATMEIAQIAAGAETGKLKALANYDTVSTDLIDDGAVTSAKILDGTIVNADIAANANIAQSKIAGLADSIADAKKAGTDAASALSTYTKSNDAAVAKKADTATVNAELAKKQDALGYTAENTANKVTAISSTSTDTQYPSAKAVYAELAKKQNNITIDSALSSTSTNPVQNKVVNTALEGKIPVPTATNDSGLLVLTYNSTTKTYAWENIGR